MRRARLRSVALPCALATLVCAAGCSGDKITEIVISVATDLQVPLELKAIGLLVTRNSKTQIDNKWDLAAQPQDGFVTLPATVGLLPQDDLVEPLLITVSGYDRDKNLAAVKRSAQLSFLKDRILWLRMNLLKRCLYKDCPPNYTCTDKGECEPIAIDPRDLPIYTGISPIGNVDAGPPADGAGDASVSPDKSIKPDLNPKPDAPADTKPTPDTKPPVDTKPTPDLDPCPHPQVVKICNAKWCKIPAGCFTMGSPTSALCYTSDEVLHDVTLTRDFEMMQYEVTEAEFGPLMQSKGITWSAWPFAAPCGVDCPADTVSWDMAVAYCNELSPAADRCFTCTFAAPSTVSCTLKSFYTAGKTLHDCPGYRLPTEAEWEYAIRAGTSTDYYNGDSQSCNGFDGNASLIGWYADNNPIIPPNTKARKQKGGQKTPNGWGLHDMAGNIYEWCHDGYDPALTTKHDKDPIYKPTATNRVLRGGDYGQPARKMRSGDRYYLTRTGANWATGFRCVRSLTNTTPAP